MMEAVCIMKGLKPKKVAGEKVGTKVDDYWEAGRTLLQVSGGLIVFHMLSIAAFPSLSLRSSMS